MASRKGFTSFFVAALWLSLGGVAPALSLFQVGNSFTFDSKPDATEVMLEANLGVQVDLGYHIRGNQTLDSLWNSPTAPDTFVTSYGNHTQALPNNSWDYLTLQSFPAGSNPTLGQELARISDFVAAADLGSGGSTEIIVYGPWAGRAESAWNDWDDPVVDDPNTLANYSSAYHDLLYDHVAAMYPGRTRLASAGKVIREMRDRIDAGDSPFTNTEELYRDTIHMSRIGRFVGSTVIQTSILGRSTVGQPVPFVDPNFEPAIIPADIARWIQIVTWEVMLADSRSMVAQPVAGDYDGNGEVDHEDLRLWQETVGSTETLLADGNGDGVVNAADFTFWRDHYEAANSVVPEPGSAAIVAVGLLVAATGRRRRALATARVDQS